MTSPKQGHFELTEFHGIPAVIFDSHWFAHKIQETHGKRWMCMEIRQAAEEEYANIEKDFVLEPHSCYAAMMPYRDFMAVHKSPGSEKYSSLDYLFQLEGSPKSLLISDFRRETALRMLASPPIRYCIPLQLTRLIRGG